MSLTSCARRSRPSGLFTELLKSAPPEHQQRYLEVIKEQSELLTKLVEDILDLSRLTAFKSRPVELTEVDLNLLVDQVVSAQKLIADAAGLSLVFEPDLELPHIQAEQNQIARLINNLITNAIHYTQAGEVRVKTTKCENKGLPCLSRIPALASSQAICRTFSSGSIAGRTSASRASMAQVWDWQS